MGRGGPITDRARGLRRDSTEAERLLWYRLRDRRFGGVKFRRQKPVGGYFVDFVSTERRLVIELDGGQHAEQREADELRTRWLESRGYRVLRFWDDDVLLRLDSVLEVIRRALEEGEGGGPSP